MDFWKDLCIPEFVVRGRDCESGDLRNGWEDGSVLQTAVCVQCKHRSSFIQFLSCCCERLAYDHAQRPPDCYVLSGQDRLPDHSARSLRLIQSDFSHLGFSWVKLGWSIVERTMRDANFPKSLA